MKVPLFLAALLAGASSSMATITAVTSVSAGTNLSPPYTLLSITVGSTTYSQLAYGTSTGQATGATGTSITFIDDNDLNTLAARNAQTTVEISTINFGGSNFVSAGGAFDFFLFESANAGDPDNVAIQAIFPGGAFGQAVLLPTASGSGFAWGLTGYNVVNPNGNGGQPIVGVGWSVTDLLDGSGFALAQNTPLEGIRILNSGANTQAAGLDVNAFVAVVPETSTSALLLIAFGTLGFVRRRL